MRSVKSARTFPMLKSNEQETAEKEDELPLLVPEEEDYQIPDSFGDGYDLHFQELGNFCFNFHLVLFNLSHRGWRIPEPFSIIKCFSNNLTKL